MSDEAALKDIVDALGERIFSLEGDIIILCFWVYVPQSNEERACTSGRGREEAASFYNPSPLRHKSLCEIRVKVVNLRGSKESRWTEFFGPVKNE